MSNHHFFSRDISWLYFNGRVMEEAADNTVPLLERIKFLSIFSSNLDEFYRVRMPVIHALKKISEDDNAGVEIAPQPNVLQQAKDIINKQQERFGTILRQQIIPLLKEQNIHLLYNEPFIPEVKTEADEYFLAEALAYLQPVFLNDGLRFFPENNKLYFVVHLKDDAGHEKIALLNIPSDELPRFFTVKTQDDTFIAMLDDVICYNLDKVFPRTEIIGCYSIKITRDAELDLDDEYPGDISEEVEKQLKKRDLGLATRFLIQSGIPLRILQLVVQQLDLTNATITEGGRYHNLKDLFSFPINLPGFSYPKWPETYLHQISNDAPLASFIKQKDILVSTPYQSYHPVLRFFNEAAINPDVKEIYITLYRVASNSTIVHALISAARNGKSVTVVVELKARFDEANNLKWARKMKDAGVKIIYSVTALKVHAKVALVKTQQGNRMHYTGLLATGNFNETTAKFYTDHVLLTANTDLLREVELLFIFLSKREKPSANNQINFKHLLVAQFNLARKFIELIDREINNAKQGLPAHITLKLNNLEEQTLINKLYEASQAGVKVSLIVRSICCLVPGVAGMSQNITIKRIVGRNLEHGRVFIFHNNGNEEVFMGSADWMNRNIHHRIEVCFPIVDEDIKVTLKTIVGLQLQDNVKAVYLDSNLENTPIIATPPLIDAQQEIYNLLAV